MELHARNATSSNEARGADGILIIGRLFEAVVVEEGGGGELEASWGVWLQVAAETTIPTTTNKQQGMIILLRT